MQKASLIIVRMFADNGYSASMSRVAAAIRYTADNGSRVANASWGGGYGYNGDALYNAIAYVGSKGELFVTAAGNSGRNLDSSYYNDYPAEYNLSNIVVVGAITSSSSMASYSNYGANQVDVMAPGSSVLSTLPGNKYASYSGTSMATPMVTGAAGLMLAANPSLTTSQLKSRLIAGSDKSTALNNRSVSDGKLNVKNAVNNTAGIQLASLTTSRSATTTVASDVLFTTSTADARTAGGGDYGRHSFHGRA
jgi:subtilisin family serine protease